MQTDPVIDKAVHGIQDIIELLAVELLLFLTGKIARQTGTTGEAATKTCRIGKAVA